MRKGALTPTWIVIFLIPYADENSSQGYNMPVDKLHHVFPRESVWWINMVSSIKLLGEKYAMQADMDRGNGQLCLVTIGWLRTNGSDHAVAVNWSVEGDNVSTIKRALSNNQCYLTKVVILSR